MKGSRVPTLYDGSVRQPAEVWRSLRRRRAAPPGSATSSPSRADTFRSALEQAEQQFRAAASVDYDSRALNLYYGASQAGRALAATARVLGPDSWTLRGHGLKAHLGDVTTSVAVVGIEPDGKTNASFTRLSSVLQSPLPGLVTLGELWPSMYETTLHAPLGDTQHPPLHVHLGERLSVGARGLDTATIELPHAITDTPVEERPPLSEFLGRYPALAGWRTATPAGTEVGWPEPNQAFELQWELTDTDGRSGHVVGDRLTRYRKHQMAFPTVAGEAAALHPLMAWWGVLYALSMLTRYQPAEWTALIDVNNSQHATAVEFVLDAALAAVPDLLDERSISFRSQGGPAATAMVGNRSRLDDRARRGWSPVPMQPHQRDGDPTAR